MRSQKSTIEIKKIVLNLLLYLYSVKRAKQYVFFANSTVITYQEQNITEILLT